MINEKMRGLGSCRSCIRELFEYGKRLAAERGADSVFDFSLGNPSIPAPQLVTDELMRLIESTPAERLHAYTSAPGDMEVRRSVADHIRRTHGVEACAELVYMTAGAAAALTSALTAVVCPGEEVIVLAPFFPEYRVFIERTGASVKPVMCRPENFRPDAALLEDAITPSCAAVIINSPNNPTGAVYTEEDIVSVCEVLRRKSEEYGKTIYLIADEPYRELVYGDKCVPYLTGYYNDTIVCYSYSKSLSLPGERIGYVFVSPKARNAQDVFDAVQGAGRALGYVCAPSLLQKLISACHGQCADIEVYRRNRDTLFDALTEYGFEIVPPDGAFYLFIKAPGGDAVAFSEKSKALGILLVPSDDFGCSGYVRLAYCQSPDMIQRSLAKFRELAELVFGEQAK